MAHTGNKYGDALELFGQKTFDEIPKAVFANLAYYLAILCTHADERAVGSRILEEWDALYANDIVPQKPSKDLRTRLHALRRPHR